MIFTFYCNYLYHMKNQEDNVSNHIPKIKKFEALLDRLGNLAVESFHYIALFLFLGCMVILVRWPYR